jgi:hypothetical protein
MGCSAAWWMRGRGGGFMWRLGLCVSKSGRDGWAWSRWLVLSARRLCVFWGLLALVGFGLRGLKIYIGCGA